MTLDCYPHVTGFMTSRVLEAGLAKTHVTTLCCSYSEPFSPIIEQILCCSYSEPFSPIIEQIFISRYGFSDIGLAPTTMWLEGNASGTTDNMLSAKDTL